MSYFKIALLCFLVTIGVGIYSEDRFMESMTSFWERKMGAWITAFAYGTSYFSAVVFVGYAGKFGWANGLSVVWIGIGNAVIGCLLAWILLAKKTRVMTHKLNASTMPEFFAARYDSVSMKIVSAVVIFVFLVPYTASIYKGLGYMFESAFGLPMNTIILIMTGLTGLYLILGGYVATAINDLIQGVIMLVGTILMVAYILSHPEVGGLTQGIAKLSSMDSGLTSFFGPAPLKRIWFCCQPVPGGFHQIHKFCTVKDKKSHKAGNHHLHAFLADHRRQYLAWVPLDRVMLTTGFSGNMDDHSVMQKSLARCFDGSYHCADAFSSITTLIPGSCLKFCDILDLIKGFVKPDIDDKKNMMLMRFFCFIFVVLSFFMAIWENPTIDALMALSWGVISGMFIAPYLFGLLWKGTTRIGAWSGFATGFLVMLIGLAIELPKTGFDMAKVFVPGIGAIAMLASLVVVPVVSLVTKKYSKAHISKVFDSERTAA